MSEKKIDLSARVSALLGLAQSAGAALAAQFGPGQPPEAAWGDEPPRLFEYASGANLVTVPRAGYGVLPFPVLRALAQSSKEIRLNIELIKRTVRGLGWEIVGRDDAQVDGYQRETKSLTDFFERPDGVNDFDAWVNMLLEDLLVLDAVTIYPDVDESGRVLSLDLVDGATIRPLLDLRGRIPRPPAPAYLQILHGMAATHYAADRLIYAPLNTKVHSPYGESPIEWAIMAVNTAIRHDLQRMGYFTEGNIPGVLVSVDIEKTSPEQIKVFQEYYDALAKGDIARASKILFVPSMGNQSIFQPQMTDVDKIEVDKWLMQVMCWAFGNNPAEFGLVAASGLGGAGYVQGMENAQYRSMIGPITGYLKSLFDRILRDFFRRPDAEFRWKGLEPPEDELRRAQIDQVYLSMGVYSPAYVQERLGVPPKYRASSTGALLPVFGASSAGLPFQPQTLAPLLERAARYELHRWRGNAVALFKGKTREQFASDILPLDLQNQIRAQLNECKSADDAAAVFDRLLSDDLEKRLKRPYAPVLPDPLDALKRASAQELEQAIAEYFAGLKERILKNVID